MIVATVIKEYLKCGKKIFVFPVAAARTRMRSMIMAVSCVRHHGSPPTVTLDTQQEKEVTHGDDPSSSPPTHPLITPAHHVHNPNHVVIVLDYYLLSLQSLRKSDV